MKSIMFITFLIIAILITGCGKARLDGSSDKAFKASLERMTCMMSDPEKDEFGKAFLRIGFRMSLKGKDIEDILKELDGKTSDEILEMGKPDK